MGSNFFDGFAPTRWLNNLGELGFDFEQAVEQAVVFRVRYLRPVLDVVQPVMILDLTSELFVFGQ